ncbi:unnamed protein product [Rotaria magnacalcarata]|uniref:Uncharacterized protein n=1 Tax=Rotaria magnacalcarata TaxID=392030 RepID=A0A819NUV8_9BILA|nr:unnamed protein product [Rotaria magnacalcarata]CAF4208419.1 unnamed protein product [Rotaria magnacalcarata]
MSDMSNNIRSTYNKSNSPARLTSNPTDFILSTSDFQSNEKDNDIFSIAIRKTWNLFSKNLKSNYLGFGCIN